MRLYRVANRGAKYISQRDGDCVEPKPPITVEEFTKKFPHVYLAIYEREPGFGVVIENGTMRSQKPILPAVCKLINVMEDHTHIVGSVVIAVALLLVHLVGRNTYLAR